MTKVIILGEEKQPEQKKKIEFVKSVNKFQIINDATSKPLDFKNIILLRKTDIIDFMFAYNDNPNDGCLYLGHFNDGEV